MTKTYRYRLYPTKGQATLLHEQINEACRLYNAALQERKEAYHKCKISISCYDQTYQLKMIRDDGSTGLISFKPAQDVLQRVDRAFDAFFRRVKSGDTPGYPRFKSRRRYDSITYINYGKAPNVDKKRKLILKGIGHLKVRWHRPITGTTKTCTIKREAGRWYVSFSVECESSAIPERHETVGLDVGLEAFATLSTGERIENSRFFREAQQNIARAQRRLERRTIRDKAGRIHGTQSHRRAKALQALQRAHAQVAQQRRHFHHVVARTLVNRYGLIAVEELRISNMSRSARGTVDNPGDRVKQKAGLNKSILDAAWGQFLLILCSKAVEAASLMIKVYAPGTSQLCICGAAVPKMLKDRWHCCLTCGLSVPRDQASGMVIEQRALKQLRAA